MNGTNVEEQNTENKTKTTPCFARIICFEDRSINLTHSWILDSVSTKDGGNIGNGVLWVAFLRSTDGAYSAHLYTNETGEPESMVATGTSDLLGEFDLEEANKSGLSGQFCWEKHEAEQLDGPVYVSLATDKDLAIWNKDYALLNAYSEQFGMAEFHAWAMSVVLDSISRRFAKEFGGYGSVPWWQAGVKLYPDLRRIANPESLNQAQALAVLYQAEIGMETSPGRRDFYQTKYAEVVGGLLLKLETEAQNEPG